MKHGCCLEVGASSFSIWIVWSGPGSNVRHRAPGGGRRMWFAGTFGFARYFPSQLKPSRGIGNAVSDLPYLQRKRCVIDAFPVSQTGGLRLPECMSYLNTGLSLSCFFMCFSSNIHFVEYVFKNTLSIKPHPLLKGFTRGWQGVIHAHFIKRNEMCQCSGADSLSACIGWWGGFSLCASLLTLLCSSCVSTFFPLKGTTQT